MRTDRRGFSLIELLVGMAFLAVFAAVVQSACTALLRGVRVLESASEAQETARLGVQLIVADAREAGFAPGGRLDDGVRRASRTVLGIARDLNGDGDVDDAQERVTYSYAADRRALLRAQGDAAPQPLIDGLDDDGLALSYVDTQGMTLDPGSTELDAGQRARIRRIGVRVRIALPSPDPASRTPLRAEESATATLRNAGL
jgi:prepilin-type N-terminal cleavage/methylation domain-containing protein